MRTPGLSVVIATWNRLQLLGELLDALNAQTLAPGDFEVVVVDDGSKVPVAPELARRRDRYALKVVTQANAGAAAARDAGVRVAKAPIVVITDDDMLVPPEFLAEHKKAHDAGYTLVLGHIDNEPGLASKPLFERFHAEQLARFVARYSREPTGVRGVMVCTGNVSFRRDDYLRVGGFDRSLDRSEDRELGVRLQKAGARLYFAKDARTINRSDHADLEVWMTRNFRYGVYDSRIHHKHPEVVDADPWHFLFLVNPVSRALLLLSASAPSVGKTLSRAAYTVAEQLDARRELHPALGRAAVAGATLSYGLEYFRGVREEAGSLPRAWLDLARHTVAHVKRKVTS
ncbi:MAG: glycosyltransferase [Myxococcus sp.]|nr:glycosyltransferase [Myxococcus sp.]